MPIEGVRIQARLARQLAQADGPRLRLLLPRRKAASSKARLPGASATLSFVSFISLMFHLVVSMRHKFGRCVAPTLPKVGLTLKYTDVYIRR